MPWWRAFAVSVAFLVVPMRAASGAAPAGSASPAPLITLADESQDYSVAGVADILDDPTGNLDIDDVAHSKNFRPPAHAAEPPDNLRWYRFRAIAPAETDGRWYIATQTRCPEADLYAQRPDGTFSLQSFGAAVPFIRRQAPGYSPAITVSGLRGQTLFVKLRCQPYARQLLRFASRDTLTAESFALTPGYPSNTALLALAILSLLLAIVTRSRSYVYLGLSGVSFALTYFAGFDLPRWIPTLSPPPHTVVIDLGRIGFLIAQGLFYASFFELRSHHRRVAYVLAALVIAAVVGILAAEFTPALSASRVWAVSGTQTVLFVFVTLVAVRFALSGNPSAWFVAAGSAVYVFVNAYVTFDFDFSAFGWLYVYAPPIDAAIFLLGTGYQLRQVAFAYQRALEEKDAVQSARLSEQTLHLSEMQRHSAAFERFVPREFLSQLRRPDIIDVHLGDHIERDMGVLFTDIRGFTSMAERLSPTQLFSFLNDYYARAGPIVRDHGGFIDKYVGDAIIALFPGGAADALGAAIAVQNEVRRFNEDRARRGEEPISVGIGVNFGRMMLGTIGEPERFETTVIADSVNIASRLEGLTKVFGVSIVASGALVSALPADNSYCLRPLGEVVLRGHDRVETAFEVFDGDPHDVVLLKRRSLGAFGVALSAYAAGDYRRSYELFGDVASQNPADRAAAYLRDRSLVMAQAATTGRDPTAG